MKLILASASPRRGTILENAGIGFERLPVEIDESPLPGESAETCVLRLAEEKARRASSGVAGPAREQEARRMLRNLSGRTHRVLTGVAALRLPDGAMLCAAETTAVTFSTLTDREIDNYVATGEPMDKAGAYGIQEQGGRFITRIEGCYFNVVGLPLARLYAMLRELRWDKGTE